MEAPIAISVTLCLELKYDFFIYLFSHVKFISDEIQTGMANPPDLHGRCYMSPESCYQLAGHLIHFWLYLKKVVFGFSPNTKRHEGFFRLFYSCVVSWRH